MAADLVIAPEAQQDIDDAYGWYEERRLGLGEAFLDCVDAAIQAICRTPELHRKVHEEYRRVLVRRFPYSIFFECVGEKVTVYCVFHTSRDPKRWQKRLA